MLKPLFYTRDFQLNHFQAPWLRVESARWSMVGGPEVARLSGVCGPAKFDGIFDGDLGSSPGPIGWGLQRLDLAGAMTLLRCGVELVDESGQAAWWGYVSGVEYHKGSLGVVADLEKMNNRVKVSYTSLNINTPSGGGIVKYGTWGDELTSQGIYGVKEKIINLLAVSDALATIKTNLEIAENGYPEAIPIFKTQVGKPDLFLTLRGWWNTAGWRYYSRADGLIQDVEESAFQIVGSVVGNQYALQSFTVPVSNWRVECVWLKAATLGTPGDNLRVDILSDVGGYPGASLANVQIAGSTILHSYGWKCFVFSSPPTLAAGTYWIVVQRSGSFDAANAYMLKVDENQSYTGGVMWVNGSLRSPAADMVFQVLGGTTTTEQIGAMAGAGAGGQFLNGVRVEITHDIYTNQYRYGTRTALEEMNYLLAAGGLDGKRLLAEVTQDRYLRVYVQPAASDAELYVYWAGLLADRVGVLAPVWTPAQADGRWWLLCGGKAGANISR
jgi:hypothetical protein